MLDLNQINALPNNAKVRYLALEKLFGHSSYKFLIDWAAAQVKDNEQRVLTATNWDQHCFHTGARCAFENIVKFEEFSEAEFAQVAAEAQVAAKEAEEEEQNGMDD
jgi:hypothetical protein